MKLARQKADFKQPKEDRKRIPDMKQDSKPTSHEDSARREFVEKPHCPDGTKEIGSAPPQGWEKYCVLIDEGEKKINHSLFTSWYENGQPSSQGAYKHGKRHGPWNFWYSDGNKRLDAEYLDGEQHGKWTFWNKDGSKRKEVEYNRGLEIK